MSIGKSFKGSVMLGTGFVLSDDVFLLEGKAKCQCQAMCPWEREEAETFQQGWEEGRCCVRSLGELNGLFE